MTFPIDPQAPLPQSLVMHDRVEDVFPLKVRSERPKSRIGVVALPVQGRLEREHLYHWIIGEEGYAANKFDAEHERQRMEHDDSLREHGLNQEGFWLRQIFQYFDRARLFFENAQELGREADAIERVGQGEFAYQKKVDQMRHMERAGQQALAKAMMTMKGCVESSIRVFGPLPRPGLSSGYVEEWT